MTLITLGLHVAPDAEETAQLLHQDTQGDAPGTRLGTRARLLSAEIDTQFSPPAHTEHGGGRDGFSRVILSR